MCITARTQTIPRRAFPPSSHPRLTRFHLISANEVHTFTPSLSNEFRLGYNRFFTQTVVPAINFPGLAQFPNLYFL